MALRHLLLPMLTCLLISIEAIHGLRVEGTLSTSEDWKFLARFCFLSQKGSLRFTFEYPAEYKTQDVLLYFDEPGQWDSVYKKSLTCAQKVSVLNPANNQIISLSTLYTWSGCKEETANGVTKVKCTGGRTFRSSRERWWYLAISRCDPGTTGTTGLYLKYRLHMTNAKEGDILRREFSADEFYILPIVIAFLLTYVIVLGISILFAYLLRQRQLFHTTYKMYMISLGFWTFGLLLYSIAYGRYSSTGFKETGTEYAARACSTLSYLTFVLMIILMAKGYTITRGRLTTASTIKISVFFTLYTITFVVLFIYEALVFDPGEVLYLYESPPGYGLIALRILGWAWFCYSVFFTLKNYKSKSMFYYPFFIFYTIWFWAGPIVILIAMFVINLWVREKTVVGVENLVTFCGHIFFLSNVCLIRFWLGPIVSLCAAFAIDKWIRAKTVFGTDLFLELCSHLFFLILTRPQAANKNFPYHVRTSQIGSLMGTGDNELDSFSSYQYAPDSRRESTLSKGPDFSNVFITSNSRSTDKLVPNESFSEFPDNAITVEPSAPPSYTSLQTPRRSSTGLPPIRRGTLTSTGLGFELEDQASPNSLTSPPSYTSMFTVGDN